MQIAISFFAAAFVVETLLTDGTKSVARVEVQETGGGVHFVWPKAKVPKNFRSVSVSPEFATAKKGGVVGVLTVSDSATNALESVFSVSKFLKGFKFTPVKVHDDDNGWTTYAAKYAPTGLVALFH